MIAKLIRSSTSLFVYFCVATILAQIIVASYLTLTWQVDRDKVVQILAIARGVDIFAIREQAQRDRDQVSPEQVSYQQIRETRAVKVRHLELREQALQQGLAGLLPERAAQPATRGRRHRKRERPAEAGIAQTAAGQGTARGDAR
jgi:hypothetical protein